MLSISALIDFLLDLLRDDDAMAEFERDPDAALAAAGLSGVTADDVRDAATALGDHDGVSCDPDHDGGNGGYSGGHHGDHVAAIHHVTKKYHAEESVVVKNHYNTYNDYDVSYVDQSTSVVNIDDRDTVIHGEDVQIYDSFNGNSGATLVNDSFNSDDDTVVVVEDSYNEVTNDVTAINESIIVSDSFNEVENDVVAINESENVTVVQDVGNHHEADPEPAAPEHTPV